MNFITARFETDRILINLRFFTTYGHLKHLFFSDFRICCRNVLNFYKIGFRYFFVLLRGNSHVLIKMHYSDAVMVFGLALESFQQMQQIRILEAFPIYAL